MTIYEVKLTTGKVLYISVSKYDREHYALHEIASLSLKIDKSYIEKIKRITPIGTSR